MPGEAAIPPRSDSFARLGSAALPKAAEVPTDISAEPEGPPPIGPSGTAPIHLARRVAADCYNLVAGVFQFGGIRKEVFGEKTYFFAGRIAERGGKKGVGKTVTEACRALHALPRPTASLRAGCSRCPCRRNEPWSTCGMRTLPPAWSRSFAWSRAAGSLSTVGDTDRMRVEPFEAVRIQLENLWMKA